MKRLAYITACTVLIISVFAGCGGKDNKDMSSTVSNIKDSVSNTVSDVESGISSVADSLMPESSK